MPSWLAFAVTRLLEEHFGRLVDYDFTASMETDLDKIAAGEENRGDWLSKFYFGDPTAAGDLLDPAQGPPDPAAQGLKPLVDDLGDIDAKDINSVPLGEGIVLRVGRYGPYLEVSGAEGEDPKRASVPDDIAPDELTVEKARELLETQADGDRVLGNDPDSGREIVVRNGRFGAYVTEVLPEDAPKSAKPRTGSLFKDMTQQSVGLDEALKLLSLPRLVGSTRRRTRRSPRRTGATGRTSSVAPTRVPWRPRTRSSPSTCRRRWRSTPSRSSEAGGRRHHRCVSSVRTRSPGRRS